MSQTSFTFNKPLPYRTITRTWAWPGTTSDATAQGVDVQPGWWALVTGPGVKTPRPWPNGKPGNKQWNSYGYVRTKYLVSSGSVVAQRTSQWSFGNIVSWERQGYYERCFQTYYLPTTTLQPNTSLAAQKLLAKIKAMDWNAGEMLGEVAQTAGLVVNTMNRIANAILAVKQGKVRRAMEILNVRARKALGPAQRRAINRKFRSRRERQIASDWLAINYGAIPLMQDVWSIIDHLQNREDWPIQTQASQTEYVSSYVQRTENTAHVPGTVSYVGSVDISAKAKYVVQYRADGPTIAYFRSLGLTNVPSLAWELHPGSLIVDWFLPIGSWLSNMDATFGCSFSKGVLVTKTVTRYGVEAYLSSTTGITAGGFGSKVWEVTSYSRVALTSFPANPFPKFKNPVNANHMANGLAFLVQAVHR